MKNEGDFYKERGTDMIPKQSKDQQTGVGDSLLDSSEDHGVIYCFHCLREGHTIETCTQLGGGKGTKRYPLPEPGTELREK